MNNYKLIGLFLESKDEFLKVLEKETGKNFLNPEDVSPYVTFTKDDVMEYIKRNKLQNKLLGVTDFSVDSLYQAPSTKDGMYLIQDGDTFATYSQERGIRSEVQMFDSKSDAVASFETGRNHDAGSTDALEKYVDTLFRLYLPSKK